MTETQNERISFSKIKQASELPDFLEVQLSSFENFLQTNVPPYKRENKGLQAVFKSMFPIMDNKENYILDFVEYYVEKPRYTVEECRERGVTYAGPLKVKLRLSYRESADEGADYQDTVEQV
ncbi:MAG TPA: hypothetical protein ENG82_01055, partial [Bacteroidetes bacterium]|nr:hypothetical protein [Bacteroidota bacterium]